ncbi:MAG TPA: hypothetical protein VN448_10435, partial [Gammaproteobacteria bacterium]|nr:hypothetical protein [Gammaproteobacteria bacterium]
MFSSRLKLIRRLPHLRRWVAVLLFGLLGLAAACSSLPTIVPDLAPSPDPAVQLEGARGALSATQSEAILDRLARRGPDTDIFT